MRAAENVLPAYIAEEVATLTTLVSPPGDHSL